MQEPNADIIRLDGLRPTEMHAMMRAAKFALRLLWSAAKVIIIVGIVVVTIAFWQPMVCVFWVLAILSLLMRPELRADFHGDITGR